MLVPKTIPPAVAERITVHAVLLLNAYLATIIQFAGIGSAVVFFLISAGVGGAVALGRVLDMLTRQPRIRLHPLVRRPRIVSAFFNLTTLRRYIF